MLPDGVRRFFRLDRGARDIAADVDREIAHHFAAAVEDLVQRGIAPDEARRIAEQRFGDVNATRTALLALDTEGTERRRRIELKADWWLDVRHAFNTFAAAPGVTVAAATILALGIGANAAMYGILSKLFIQPPPHIANADEIVRLYRRERSAFTGNQEITLGQFGFNQYAALHRGVPGFASLAAYWQSDDDIGRGQHGERVSGEAVTGNFFALLGTQPALGRFIEPSDDDPAATPAAVISYGLWRRRFGGSHAVLGATIDIDRGTYTIIGVAPPGFSGPEVDAPSVWYPVQIAGPAPTVTIGVRRCMADSGCACLPG